MRSIQEQAATSTTELTPKIPQPRIPAWLHIFPEGFVHQHPTLQMRYFKWGVSRFILELPSPPIILPMFLSGFQEIMHESRTFPRFIPRGGKDVRIVVGEPVPLDYWTAVRERYQTLKAKCDKVGGAEGEKLLKEGDEAQKLRIEVTKMVRDRVVKLRMESGFPPEDEGSHLVQEYPETSKIKAGRQAGGVWEKPEI